VEVPSPYAIPLPPTTEPNWELGARYWWSEGKTGFNFTSQKLDPILGNPTSKLTYDNMQGNTAELFFRATNGGNIFAKGLAGGGWLNGGSLDDEDFFAGQVKFSDTYSKMKGNSLGYVTILGAGVPLLVRRRHPWQQRVRAPEHQGGAQRFLEPAFRRVRRRDVALLHLLNSGHRRQPNSGGKAQGTEIRVSRARRLKRWRARSMFWTAKAGLAQQVERLICNQ
jgi:hypothetical protein